jgi:hypothetical protein
MSKSLDTHAVRAAILFVLSDAPARDFFEDHGGSARWLADGLARCERVEALRDADAELRLWLREFRRVARQALSERADLAANIDQTLGGSGGATVGGATVGGATVGGDLIVRTVSEFAQANPDQKTHPNNDVDVSNATLGGIDDQNTI